MILNKFYIESISKINWLLEKYRFHYRLIGTYYVSQTLYVFSKMFNILMRQILKFFPGFRICYSSQIKSFVSNEFRLLTNLKSFNYFRVQYFNIMFHVLSHTLHLLVVCNNVIIQNNNKMF